MLRKGVFPNDWFDSFGKLSETNLPAKYVFHSMLNDCDISDEDYEHAQKIWKHFEMQKVRDDHNLYFKTDALYLAGVFETFTDVCLRLTNLTQHGITQHLEFLEKM